MKRVRSVPTDVPDVRPPLVKGRTDSFWISTRTKNEKDIQTAAIRKAAMCYGMEISNLELGNQIGEEEK